MADEDRDPEGPAAEVSEAQIAVHWREEEYYPPPAGFARRPTPMIRPSWNGSPRTSSPTASRSTRTC